MNCFFLFFTFVSFKTKVLEILLSGCRVYLPAGSLVKCDIWFLFKAFSSISLSGRELSDLQNSRESSGIPVDHAHPEDRRKLLPERPFTKRTSGHLRPVCSSTYYSLYLRPGWWLCGSKAETNEQILLALWLKWKHEQRSKFACCFSTPRSEKLLSVTRIAHPTYFSITLLWLLYASCHTNQKIISSQPQGA